MLKEMCDKCDVAIKKLNDLKRHVEVFEQSHPEIPFKDSIAWEEIRRLLNLGVSK
jgi:hypothetical protein